MPFIDCITDKGIVGSNNKIKKESQKTYFFIRINSISNLIFIFLVNFDLIVECFNINYFCSSLSSSQNSQYIVGFFLKPIKNTLKTFSHISYTSFILLRYLKISNAKNVYLKKFENFSFSHQIQFHFYTILMRNKMAVLHKQTNVQQIEHQAKDFVNY